MADELGDDASEPEDELGEGAAREVPNPLDRPWTHPSELSSFIPTPLPPRETRPRDWVVGLGSAIAGAAVAVLILVAFGALGSRERAVVPPPVVSIPDTPIDYLAANRAAAVIRPSIVRVQGSGPAIGSGVALQSSRILTYAPLVVGAQQVTVTGTDGKPIQARVVGSDPETNLALLSVPDGSFPAATVEPNEDSRPGDPVVGVADGDPWWVDIDVVNDRNVLAPGFPWIAGLLRTDVAIEPTSLGGALVDPDGLLLGILVTAPGLPAATYAVPIDVARGVAEQLDTSGTVSHGWLGIVYGASAQGADRGRSDARRPGGQGRPAAGRRRATRRGHAGVRPTGPRGRDPASKPGRRGGGRILARGLAPSAGRGGAGKQRSRGQRADQHVQPGRDARVSPTNALMICPLRRAPRP